MNLVVTINGAYPVLDSEVAKLKGVESDLRDMVLVVRIEPLLLLVVTDQISKWGEAYPEMELVY